MPNETLGETLKDIRSSEPPFRREKRLALIGQPYEGFPEVELAQARIIELVTAMKEDVLPEEEDAVRNGYEKLLNTVFESTRRNNEAAGVTLEPERFEEVRDIFLDIFALTLEEPTPPEVESLKQARWTENTLRPGEVYALILRFGLIQPHQDGETDEPSLKKIGEIMGGISRAAVSEYIKNAIKKLNHPDNFERLKQFLQ